jgi:hypothetical protein
MHDFNGPLHEWTIYHNQWVSHACILKAHSRSHSKSEGSIWASLECQCCFWIAYARIPKAHSHSMSVGSIWASLECHCCFWIAERLVSYLAMWLLNLQLFKNSIDTQGKLRLNLHALFGFEWAFRIQASVSISATQHSMGPHSSSQSMRLHSPSNRSKTALALNLGPNLSKRYTSL